jgi:hypothetical protein
MTILTKDAILEAKDLEVEVVSVPEWGGDVMVRMMTALSRDTYEMFIFKADEKEQQVNFRARLCSLCICNEKGKLLFTEKDIVKLGEKSAEPVKRIFEVARKLNGIGDGAVEDIEKNLPKTPGEDL